jgi:hypothetical protein
MFNLKNPLAALAMISLSSCTITGEHYKIPDTTADKKADEMINRGVRSGELIDNGDGSISMNPAYERKLELELKLKTRTARSETAVIAPKSTTSTIIHDYRNLEFQDKP